MEETDKADQLSSQAKKKGRFLKSFPGHFFSILFYFFDNSWWLFNQITHTVFSYSTNMFELAKLYHKNGACKYLSHKSAYRQFIDN